MIYIGTTAAYILFSLGQPLARNIETLLITRFFAGLFASASLTVPAGSIADVWEPVGRGRAVSIYSATVFAGPIIGPIIGGFVISSHLGWKWVFWIPIILAAAALPFIVFMLPETCAPAILSRKSKRLRKSGHPFAYSQQEIDAKKANSSFQDVLNRTVLRPFIMLSLEPILILITLYSSIVYGLIYGLFEAIPIIFSEIRGISTELTGLMFFALGIGTTAGAYLTFLDGRRWLELTPKWRGTPPPEERLRTAVPAGPLLVIAVFWLGWTGAYRAVPWYAVVLSLIPLGVGITLLAVTFQVRYSPNLASTISLSGTGISRRCLLNICRLCTLWNDYSSLFLRRSFPSIHSPVIPQTRHSMGLHINWMFDAHPRPDTVHIPTVWTSHQNAQ
jgi:DHA1 family multidrug resistance protein-like MFS transporter